MERKEQIVITIIVVLLVILAGLVYALTNQKTEPTQAQRMMLKPSELGADWIGIEEETSLDFQGLKSWDVWEFSRQSNEYWMPLDIGISVYNSTDTCESAYLISIAPFIQDQAQNNCTNINIGDGGIAFNLYYGLPIETGGFPGIIFHEKNVLCGISVPAGAHTSPVPWWKGTLMYFATAQLQKIDQNLVKEEK